MESEVSCQVQGVESSFFMAWTAYVRPLIIFIVLSAIAIVEVFQRLVLVGVGIELCALAILVFQVLTIRSVRLYTDADGVWVYRGILPWSKGVNGVKWRDLEDAVYFTGFVSWALRSYTVRIGHRFTKTSEIVLSHIARGNLAVEHINQRHRETLANGAV